jgi:putative tryptophan/tyrosine transport system substrate-binding protein
MRRREFMALLGGAAAAWPLPTQAQQPASTVRRLGYLFSFKPAEGNHLWEACRLGLRQLGYVEGRGIVLEPRWADGRHERLPGLAADLVRLKVDIIISAATPAALAAKAATRDIPIVMVGIGDPLKSGLIASLSRPGGNVTGLSLLTADLSGKRLELLAEVMRDLPRVAVLINPDNPVHAIFHDETRAAALSKGVELQSFTARNPREIQDVFADASIKRIAALIVYDDPVIWSHRQQIVALAAKQRLPVIYGYREFVDAGGLMSYGPDRIDHYRRTAYYVDKILKGAKPADLPVEQPTKFDLIVNSTTAKELGLAIPPSFLARADEVVE